MFLHRDSEWSVIAEEPCKVVQFDPLSCFKEERICGNKKPPYACVILECNKVTKKIKADITNKIDFIHLWKVFRERNVKENEEFSSSRICSEGRVGNT